MRLITWVRCGHRVRLALRPPVALQKALFAVLAPADKLMGYRASYPECSEADHLVEIHSSGNGERRAGMIVAAIRAGIFAVVLLRRRAPQCSTASNFLELHTSGERGAAPAWAVVVTASASANADQDNVAIVSHYDSGRWWIEGETRCLADPARRLRPTRRRQYSTRVRTEILRGCLMNPGASARLSTSTFSIEEKRNDSRTRRTDRQNLIFVEMEQLPDRSLI